MARYIDANVLTERIKYYHEHTIEDSAEHYAYGVTLKEIDKTPTADVVEVVRCKDCTEWDKYECECSHWYGFRENDFCSYGKRRIDNG